MAKPKPSSIGYKSQDGITTDTKLHEEIMAGVDDTSLRVASAQRAVAKLGLTRKDAETLFDVKLPPDTAPA